jgi:sugar phosphate isomerase/epimerase
MQLLVMRHLWGVAEAWEIAFPRIKQSGYDGIEAPLPPPDQQEHFQKLLGDYGFAYIAMLFTSGGTSTNMYIRFDNNLSEHSPSDLA